MSKYKKHFTTMVNEYHDFFTDFKALHDTLAAGDESVRDDFNEKGQKILKIIRRYDNELCSKSENSGFGKFSTNLSEKFWEEVRIYLPLIDQIPLE
jgi:hypothetical protein